MRTPVPLDMEPMLAGVQPELPGGSGWVYEPKWDGFRIIAQRDGDDVELVSRGARPMTRYFPEMLAPLRELPADPFVLDGELVIVGDEGLDFDALQMRIHPAESRIRQLSQSIPVTYVVFDLLAAGPEDLRPLPLGERRRRLEELLRGAGARIRLTPSTRDPAVAGRSGTPPASSAGGRTSRPSSAPSSRSSQPPDSTSGRYSAPGSAAAEAAIAIGRSARR